MTDRDNQGVHDQQTNAGFASSEAAALLDAGLRAAAEERGLSRRSIAKLLGYKQSVVLSHMALGRVPIPIERVSQLAKILLIDERIFMRAVLEQRFPDFDWETISKPHSQPATVSSLCADLELLANGSLDGLSATQQKVLREVVADPRAASRWLSVHEIPVISLLRAIRPLIQTDGLSAADRGAITGALHGVEADYDGPGAIF